MAGQNKEASDAQRATRRKLVGGTCNLLLLVLMSCAAMCCTFASMSYCNFMNRKINIIGGMSPDEACKTYFPVMSEALCNSMFESHGVGFWGVQITVPVDNLMCYSYTQPIQAPGGVGEIWVTPTFDTKFNSARAFSVTASFFGLLAFFSLGFSLCFPISKSRMKCLSFYFIIACFFQGMTFLFQKSSVCSKGFFDVYFQYTEIPSVTDDVIDSVECTLSKYTNMAIAATVLYFLCAGLCCASLPLPGQYSPAPEVEEEPVVDVEKEAGTTPVVYGDEEKEAGTTPVEKGDVEKEAGTTPVEEGGQVAEGGQAQ